MNRSRLDLDASPPALATLAALAALATLAGCATNGTLVRQIASRDLGCPESAIRVKRAGGHIFSATGCGASMEIACYDPHESTGAHKGWADGATAGHRSRCEALLERPVVTTSTQAGAGSVPPAHAPSSGGGELDRALAAKLLAAGAQRATVSCRRAEGPIGPGKAKITFDPDGSVTAVALEPPYEGTDVGRCVAQEMTRVSLPAFRGAPITVGKTFVIPAPVESEADPNANATHL